jgi:hypothetical protein
MTQLLIHLPVQRRGRMKVSVEFHVIANSLAIEPRDSVLLIPVPVIGHHSEPVPFS